MFIVYISLLFGEFMICPLCKKPLEKKGKSYLCPSAHCFDLAKQGYVNLLSVKEKSSLDPGDNKEMILSRRKVLDREICRRYGCSDDMWTDTGAKRTEFCCCDDEAGESERSYRLLRRRGGSDDRELQSAVPELL